MLKLQCEGSWIAVDPARLAEMMLEGQVQRNTPARDATKSESTKDLEDFLRDVHHEALSAELLQRLQRMYLSGSRGVDPLKLREQVVKLCDWKWTDRRIRGRLFWSAAWLYELTEDFEKAVSFYRSFLHCDSPEQNLRLLARNNRGVLRIRLGRPGGIRDLALAAIASRALDGWKETALPSAAFSLLNLLNRALQEEMLIEPVERFLLDYLVGLGLESGIRRKWIGLDPVNPEDKLRGSDQTQQTRPDERSTSQDRPPGLSKEEEARAVEESRLKWLRSHLGVLKEYEGEGRKRRRLYTRFARLTSNLALRAEGMAPAERPGEVKPDWIGKNLVLWDPHPPCSVPGDDTPRGPAAGEKQQPHDRYVEAVAILYGQHIPSSFRRHTTGVRWVEEQAKAALARAGLYLAAEDYGQALVALQGALEAVRGEGRSRRIRALVRRLEREQRAVQRQQKDHERRRLTGDLQGLCNDVEGFCRQSDPYEIWRRRDDLRRRLETLQADVRARFKEASGRLLDDLFGRMTAHAREVERRDLEVKLREPRGRLDANWPPSWNVRVPAAAYEALGECQRLDLNNTCEDWPRVLVQLRAHDAQHELQQVLRCFGAAGQDRRDLEKMLGRCLALNPNLGPVVAPLYCFLALPEQAPETAGLQQLRQDLLQTAIKLLDTEPLGREVVWNVPLRARLIEQACGAIQQLLRTYQGCGEDVGGLWEHLMPAFDLSLDEGRPEIIAEIEQVLEICLGACPTIAGGRGAPADPRNPIQICLEKGRLARLIGEGEQRLNGRPSDREGAARCFTEAMGLGLGGRHLRRAATGLYLAKLGLEDSTPVQRRILSRLEDWVLQLGEDDCLNIRAQDIARQIEKLREQRDEGRPDAGPGPPGPPPEGPATPPSGAGTQPKDGAMPSVAEQPAPPPQPAPDPPRSGASEQAHSMPAPSPDSASDGRRSDGDGDRGADEQENNDGH